MPLYANLYTTRVVLRKRSSTIFSDFWEIITIYCGLFALWCYNTQCCAYEITVSFVRDKRLLTLKL